MFSGLCLPEFLFLTILLYLILVGKVFFLRVNFPPFECPFGISERKSRGQTTSKKQSTLYHPVGISLFFCDTLSPHLELIPESP